MNLDPDWQEQQAVCPACLAYTKMYGSKDEYWTCCNCGAEIDDWELQLHYIDDEGGYEDE